uniref:Immunoglobulin domain-containing protein n=1 Tax=Oncorhynchus kisutch TaxID=8019 RepID=A0A8C7JJ15_ONCKI
DCCEKSVTETAFLGGEATIRCNYPEDHKDDIKYFCKEDSESDCENKISDIDHEKPRRYSLSKRRRERFYTVTISDLTEDDTGTYWCGVETSRTEQHYITLITQVNCSYLFDKTDHKKNEKFFCKGDLPLTCEDKVTATKRNIIIRNKRFSLRDNSEKTNFTVHIKMMRPEDSGTYWCGSDRRWRPADYTRFILSVGEWINSLHQTPSQVTEHPSSGVRVCVPGTSVVIMVSSYYCPLSLSLSLIYIYISSPFPPPLPTPPPLLPLQGCHGDGDYEEIMERAPRSDSGAATSTIYTTVNLPTSHSDYPHYASVNFHKNPKGSCPNEATASITKEGTSSCDYATAPPIYSTVSKPRDT